MNIFFDKLRVFFCRIFGSAASKSKINKTTKLATSRKKTTANYSDLMVFLKAGNQDQAIACLPQNKNLEETDLLGDTLLLVAIRKKMTTVIKTLVENGASLSVQTPNYESALTLAIKSEDEDLVLFLLEKGVPIQMELSPDEPPLMIAARLGLTRVVRSLIDLGADPTESVFQNWDVIHSATGSKGTLEIVKILIENGAEVDSRQNPMGHTPLMRARGAGKLDIIKFLVENGANPTLQENQREHDEFGKTPLMFAAENGNIEVVKYLVSLQIPIDASLGAINVESQTGNLNTSRYSIRDELSTKSLKDTDDALMATGYGKTALYYAVENNHLEVAKFLISQGARTDITDGIGNSLLKIAVSRNLIPMVEFILPYCPDFHAPNIYGHSAYSFAKDYRPEIFDIFSRLNNSSNSS